MEKYLNSNLPAKDRVVDLLSKMTVEEKAAQLTQFMGKKSYVIKDNKVSEKDLPDFLFKRIQLEKEIIGTTPTLPHVDQNSQTEIIMNLAPLMEDFI